MPKRQVKQYMNGFLMSINNSNDDDDNNNNNLEKERIHIRVPRSLDTKTSNDAMWW